MLKLCLRGVKFTEIFIELTKHYHWQFLWVAQFPESLLSLCWEGGEGREEVGRRNQGSQPPKKIKIKKIIIKNAKSKREMIKLFAVVVQCLEKAWETRPMS